MRAPPTLAAGETETLTITATVDAGTSTALLTAPLAPPVLLLNQSKRLRDRIWPWVRRRLHPDVAQRRGHRRHLVTPLPQWRRVRQTSE